MQLGGKLLDYILAKVSLIRAACPAQLEGKLVNQSLAKPIIIEANPGGIGALSAAAYAPKALIVAGNARKKFLLQRGVVSSWAWIQAGAMDINVADAMSSQELLGRLSGALVEKFYGVGKQPILGQQWPSILEVYPFEDYMICSMKGQKYRQGFVLDPVERKVRLNGGAVEINAGGDATESMPRVQTGVRWAYAPMRGNVQTTTQGAKNSELVTCLVRNWANIEQAANDYVAATKTGLYKPMKPAFCPVDLTPTGELSKAFAAVGIDVFEFAHWSAGEFKKYQTRNGKNIPRSKFAYAPSADPSTWKLPMDTPGRAKNALARLNQVQGVQKTAKTGLMHKVRKVAKSKGIGVSDKPSSKQTNWAQHRTA